MTYYQQIFGTGSDLEWWQECTRAVVVFVFGLAAVRLAGRRLFGKWAALDVIVSVVIGSILGRIVTGDAPMLGTLVATALLLALHWLLAHGSARWQTLSRLVEGEPKAIVEQGRLDQAAMYRSNISRTDLDEALRQKGLRVPADAKEVILEPSGKLTILKK